LDEILDQKTRVHHLISQNADERDEKNRRAYALTGTNPKTIDDAQYRAFLLARSSTAEQAHQAHETWMRAYIDAYESEVLAEFESLLNERSQLLSKRYAEQSWELQNHSGDVQTLSAKQLTDLSRFWQVVAGPTTSPQPSAAADIAKAVAEKLFTRQAAKALGRALPRLALLYPTELADGELGASVFATSASEIGVSRDMDLAFIASRKGTVDVTHRMSLEETDGELTPAWVKADGVTIGTKVPVRSFVYNPNTQAYEFARDGDTKPSLIWTPAVMPANSSTFLPAETPDTSPYSGATLSPVSDTFGDYPTYDAEFIEDLILVFPEESGLKPIYLVFSQRAGDHQYHIRPTSLLAFPEAKQAHGKTRIQGGGKTRPRWKDHAGNIYEWDFRHGTIEKYNKRGVHLGEYNADTGMQTKPADPTRKIEP
jgi:hypothetical protein